MKYFVRTADRRWGFGDSVMEALKKAEALPDTQADAYAEVVDCYFYDRYHCDDLYADKSEVGSVDNYLEDVRGWDPDDDYSVDFQLIAVPDEWTLAEVSMIDGNPSFHNNGHDPDHKPDSLNLNIDGFGKITASEKS